MTKRPALTGAGKSAHLGPNWGGVVMSQFSIDDQWRSFQTFVAAYLAGMLHPLDVFTISRRTSVSAPLGEFRCEASGALRFSLGDRAWSDDPRQFVRVRRDDINQAAAQTVGLLRSLNGIDEPGSLRLSGSGPASSVAVLAAGGFMSGGGPENIHPARLAAHIARMKATIDTDGDVIEVVAQEAGDRAFAETKNGSIAAIAAARTLAQLRTWVDPFSPTPQSGYLVGKPRTEPAG
jgi:hypothetical protein